MLSAAAINSLFRANVASAAAHTLWRRSTFAAGPAFMLPHRWETVSVEVPSMGESISEGTIQTWKKKPGEMVMNDEVVAVIDTDKISVDVNAPVAGQLVSVEAGEGETVRVGHRLFIIDTDAKKGTAPASNPSKNTEEESAAREEKVSPRGRHEARVPMSRIRQRIGERLKEAQSEGCLLTTFQECDMGAVMELRKQLGPSVQKEFGTKLGFMSFFLAACRKALEEWPTVNFRIDGKETIQPNFVDISVAVATPQGLVVPVIRDVQKKGLVELEKELASLAKQARNNKLSLEQMQGGTFTISNGGVYGSMMGTPIINPPQSGILGMHSIVQRPVVREGKVVIRPIMYLALTYDHRIIDGKEAVGFLKSVAEHIENPKELTAGVCGVDEQEGQGGISPITGLAAS